MQVNKFIEEFNEKMTILREVTMKYKGEEVDFLDRLIRIWDEQSEPLINKSPNPIPEPTPIEPFIPPPNPFIAEKASSTQVGGVHYKDYPIPPALFLHKNNVPYLEGSAIYYLLRWRSKGGIEDLKKAKHTIELLLEYEYNQ